MTVRSPTPSRIIPDGGEMSQDSNALVAELKNVAYAYPPASPELPPIPALRDVNLAIASGQVVGLVGQNGSGKTTLARHLNGLLRPDTGSVHIRGEDSAAKSVGELSRTIGYVFQNPDHALFLPTIREELLYGLNRLDITAGERDERMRAALDRFGLLDLIDTHPASLARGLRRLIIAAAIEAMHPELLVLDEPTGGLDQLLTTRLTKLMRAIADEGRSVILITHDMRLVAECCDCVVLMHDGRIIGDGTAREIFHDRELLAQSGIRAPQAARLADELLECAESWEIVTVDDLARVLATRLRR